MYPNDFEKAFGDFIDGREYDKAESALFAMMRLAFAAGWRAAGGAAPRPNRIFQLLRQEQSADEKE